MSKEAMKLALEALEDFEDAIRYDNEQDDIGARVCCGVLSYNPHTKDCKSVKAITALREDLAEQPAQQEQKCGAIIEVFGKDWRLDYMSLPVGKHKLYTQQYTYTSPQPAQQEPVAWMNPHGGFLSATYIENFASGLDKEIHNIPLYTSPPAQPGREALEAALEALQKIYIAPEHEEYIRVWWPACEQAITTLQEALSSQPAPAQQEPVDDEDTRTYAHELYEDSAQESGFFDGVKYAEVKHGIKENT